MSEPKKVFAPCLMTVEELESEVGSLRAENAALRARVAGLESAKDLAYRERNRLVAALSVMADNSGCAAWLGAHDSADASWDPDWRNIVFMDLGTGQLSWHIHDSELPLFAWLPRLSTPWDGHSTEEKYRRLAALADGEKGDGR